jgi:hypothetical protein
MSTDRDTTRIIRAWLDEGATALPDRVLDAVLDQIPTTPQRRATWWPARRFPGMNSALRTGLAAAAIVIAAVLGITLLGRGAGIGGPGPATAPPSRSASAPVSATSPSSSPALTDTSNWISFTSERYGYRISHPPDWRATGGTRDWEFETDRLNFTTTAADRFVGPGNSILVSAFAVEVPADTAEDQWIAAYYEGTDLNGRPCDVSVIEGLQPISVDDHPGRLRVNDPCADAHAFIFIEGRVHVFAVWRPSREELLQAFLSTVQFEQ